MSTFIEKDAIEYTVYNIPQSSGQDEGHTDDISGLEAFFYNLIEIVAYGVFFNESTHSQIASFMPEGGGYSTWFYGKVVDMFYFPIIDTNWPTWMPFVGGEHFIFFSPIFNFADAAISCGIIALLLFYSKYLNESYHSLDKNKKESLGHEE